MRDRITHYRVVFGMHDTKDAQCTRILYELVAAFTYKNTYFLYIIVANLENKQMILLGLWPCSYCNTSLFLAGRKHVESLQQSRSKVKVPFFWAVASLAHVFNVCMVAKFLIIIIFNNLKLASIQISISHIYVHVHFKL